MIGESNGYDFGARMYDARLGRWWSVDDLFMESANESPYISFRNNSIKYIDSDGNKWVNYYDNLVSEKRKQLLDNPDSKKLEKQLNRLIKKQNEVNRAINDLKGNDQALYYYIENMQYKSIKDGKCYDVLFEVKIGDMGSQPRTPWGGVPDATTSYSNTDKNKKFVYIEYPNLEDKYPVFPAPFNTSSNEIGFEVTLYCTPGLMASALSNEVGDAMYRMEYPDACLSRPSTTKEKQYRTEGSGDYGFDVQDMYEARKESGEGKNPNNNPYPLQEDNK